jgi:ribonuclease HI
MSKLIINTDGGSRGNPGPASIGVLVKKDDQIIFQLAKTIGVATNNDAEYKAVASALEWLDQQQNLSEEVEFLLDSKLVVEQLAKRWKIKEPRLLGLAQNCWKLISNLQSKHKTKIFFTHVPREQNADADALVNYALDNPNL